MVRVLFELMECFVIVKVCYVIMGVKERKFLLFFLMLLVYDWVGFFCEELENFIFCDVFVLFLYFSNLIEDWSMIYMVVFDKIFLLFLVDSEI